MKKKDSWLESPPHPARFDLGASLSFPHKPVVIHGPPNVRLLLILQLQAVRIAIVPLLNHFSLLPTAVAARLNYVSDAKSQRRLGFAALELLEQPLSVYLLHVLPDEHEAALALL